MKTMSDKTYRWAFYGLLAINLALHVAFLNRTPLSPDELPTVLTPLDALRREELAASSNSLMLLIGNMVLFFMFGPGNGIARLIPALAGFVLVLLPFYWRQRLGNAGSLTASGILLVSPLILFASRNVEDTILSLLAVGFLCTALMPASDEGFDMAPRQTLIFLGVSIGLVSGPAFYDLVLAGTVVWLIGHWIHRKKFEFSKLVYFRTAIIAGFGVAMLVSIGFGLRLNNWDGVLDSLARWIASWQVLADVSHIGALCLYEPFTLIAAALGLGYAWKHRDISSLSMILWASFILLMVSVRGGASITTAGMTVLPLAYLAGYGIRHSLKNIPETLTKWFSLHVSLGFLFLLPAFLGLSQYANGLIGTEQPLLVLSGAVVLISMQALLAFLMSIVLPMSVLWRSAYLGICVMSLYIQTGFALQLSFVRPTSALEPAVMAAVSPDMETLEEIVSDIALQRGLREDTLTITVVGNDADITDSVRWTLRDYVNLQVSQAWPQSASLENANMLVITPEDADLSAVNAPGWKGMRFSAVQRYQAPIPGCRRTTTIDCTDLANWYLYRTSPYPLSLKGLILWVNR